MDTLAKQVDECLERRMTPNQDIEFMERSQLKTEIINLRQKIGDVSAVIQSWVDKQGHDRCWYYPELFQQLVGMLNIQSTVDPKLPPLDEFRGGCYKYQAEEYQLKQCDGSLLNAFEDYDG